MKIEFACDHIASNSYFLDYLFGISVNDWVMFSFSRD